MKKLLIDLIKRTPMYSPLLHWKQNRELIMWERRGKPAPPPHIVKQITLREYAKKFGLKVLVETGTRYGDMVEAMKDSFDQIYSIELGDELYANANKRFDGDERIEIVHGDSGIELENLIDKVRQPALFWLDGHYSGGETARGDNDTPVYEELTHIFNTRISGHVVIIDDARCFGTYPAYPSIEELSDFVREKSPGARIEVENDSIRITPLSSNA